MHSIPRIGSPLFSKPVRRSPLFSLQISYCAAMVFTVLALLIQVVKNFALASIEIKLLIIKARFTPATIHMW